MGLRNISYQEEYRSGDDNFLEDFFGPSLQYARQYWRAVGYFSSSALEAFGAPLDNFIKRGGNIRLITSVQLSEDDMRAIDMGLTKREVSARRIEQIIEEQFTGAKGQGVDKLCALLQVERLQIQIAVPEHGRGIYHEKVGVFLDETDYVAFSGSTNETQSAFENNYEVLDVYPSWLEPGRADRKRVHFETLWQNKSKGVEVFSFPEACRKKLIQIYEAKNQQVVLEPVVVSKWRHQEEAMNVFLDAEQGVLEMATGTGKTRTAIKIILALLERHLIDTVIIATEGNDLLDQWYRQVLQLSRSLPLLSVYQHYGSRKETLEYTLNPVNSILLCSREPLTKVLNALNAKQKSRTLLIHDEVHGLGSPSNRAKLSGLSDAIRFRLGLSATPEREYDEAGNNFIEKNVGPVLFSFGLEDAIARGILAPFRYHPISYEILEEDRERLKRVFARKAARKDSGMPMNAEELAIEISKVYKTSRAKLPLFRDFVEENPAILERCIVFVETQEYGLEVLDTIHQRRPDFHTYFSGEDSLTLQRFARRDLECLVTCHRLSQGIDIQSLNSVVLFSAARARLETIQRIGRCLRTDPQNPNKIADIIDFIRFSEDDSDPTSDEERQDWLLQLSQIRLQE